MPTAKYWLLADVHCHSAIKNVRDREVIDTCPLLDALQCMSREMRESTHMHSRMPKAWAVAGAECNTVIELTLGHHAA